MNERTVKKLDHYGVARECTAYACGMCDRVYSDKKEAVACCRCAECQEKFPHTVGGRLCGHCSYGSQLRAARENVRRTEEHFTDAKTRLEQLLKNKRPKKGSVVS